MDKTNDLETRLLSLSDKEIVELISDDSKMYSDEAIQIAREVAHIRGLVSDLGEEFKVITAGGRENGPLDVLIIKGLFLRKLISAESLLYVDSQGRWLPLREVFDITRWEAKGEQAEKTIYLADESLLPKTAAKIDAPKSEPPKAQAPKTETLSGAETPGDSKAKEERLPAFIANNMGDVSAARYRGVGGWLILFAFFLVIWRLYGIWTLQAQLLSGPRNIYNFGMTVVAIEYVIGLFAVILLLFEVRKAVLFTKVYLIGLLIFNVALLVAAMQWGEGASVLSANKIYLTSTEHILDVLKETLLGRFIVLEPSVVQTAFVALVVILLYLYFSVSKRVRATYFTNDEAD